MSRSSRPYWPLAIALLLPWATCFTWDVLCPWSRESCTAMGNRHVSHLWWYIESLIRNGKYNKINIRSDDLSMEHRYLIENYFLSTLSSTLLWFYVQPHFFKKRDTIFFTC